MTRRRSRRRPPAGSRSGPSEQHELDVIVPHPEPPPPAETTLEAKLEPEANQYR